MTRENVIKQLEGTGVRQEQDFLVPVNGKQVKLPYHVIRTKETVTGSDNGNVRLLKIEWVVALFTTNRDDELEVNFLKALYNVGKVEVTRYPDGTPYQTNFKFTTNQIL